MRRGEVWTVSGSKDQAGKPRPIVIVQDFVLKCCGIQCVKTACPAFSDYAFQEGPAINCYSPRCAVPDAQLRRRPSPRA